MPVDITVLNNSPELAEDLDQVVASSVRIVSMRANIRYTGAANYALACWRRVTSPYAVIGSHDLHVAPDALRSLVTAEDQYPWFGILGPVLTDDLAGANTQNELSADTIARAEWISRACIVAAGSVRRRDRRLRRVTRLLRRGRRPVSPSTTGCVGRTSDLCHPRWRTGWGRVIGGQRPERRGTSSWSCCGTRAAPLPFAHG
jgi:hypothetical protein